MPWVTFTADHVRDGLAVREIEIYLETAGQDFEGDVVEVVGERIERIAARTVEMFRGAILANPQVSQLGPAGTMPSFCVPWAIAIARVAMLGLNPVEEGRTDPRRDEYTDAIKGRDSLKGMPAAAFVIDEPGSVVSSFPAFGGKPLLNF